MNIYYYYEALIGCYLELAVDGGAAGPLGLKSEVQLFCPVCFLFLCLLWNNSKCLKLLVDK